MIEFIFTLALAVLAISAGIWYWTERELDKFISSVEESTFLD